jgi:hypothetical protein
MSPTRFRECFAILELSRRGLAPLLRCSEHLPRAWAAEAWTVVRQARPRAFPEPAPPVDWRA